MRTERRRSVAKPPSTRSRFTRAPQSRKRIDRSTSPFVSVIIPTFNDDLRLEWVLEGLCCQTRRNFEVIVVNDAGHADTERLVTSFSSRMDVHYCYLAGPKEDSRSGAARNYGAEQSKGDLLLFLDGDVVPDPDVVEAHMAQYTPTVALFGFRRFLPMEFIRPFTSPLNYEYLHSHSNSDYRLYTYSQWAEPQWYLHFLSCNYSIPARIFCELGGHDERFIGWGDEDVDLGFRITRSGYQVYPLWGIGLVTHLNHTHRTYNPTARQWACNPEAPLCRNGGPVERRFAKHGQ